MFSTLSRSTAISRQATGILHQFHIYIYIFFFFCFVLRVQAMVVGAGPAGLATALMLAKKGWAVSVFERSPNPAAYDPGNFKISGEICRLWRGSEPNKFDEKNYCKRWISVMPVEGCCPPTAMLIFCDPSSRNLYFFDNFTIFFTVCVFVCFPTFLLGIR